MKKRTKGMMTIVIAAALIFVPMITAAQETFKYSCSNQVYYAFEQDNIKAFTQATGIAVDVRTSSSNSALSRLMNGFSDIAGLARALSPSHADYGYVQIPIIRDPIAVIAKEGCGVDSLTQTQLQDIFGGTIRNWKDLGGNDLPILVVVPGEDTAANKNFRRQVMKHKEIKYDYMAYDSTMAIEVVRHFPCGTISFISQGAAQHAGGVKCIQIDGKSPLDADYPYYQIFYYVTKGEPAGGVKKFIEFTKSEKGAEVMKKNGLIPISE